MEDFSALLSGILSDEGSMTQLREMAQELSSGDGGGLGSLLGMLGGGEKQSAPDAGGLGSLLGMLGGGEKQSAPDGGGPDLSALLSIGKTLGSLKQDDKNIALIQALEPHLGERRREKAEEAIKVLRILRLLPILRESGILDGLL